MTFSEKLKKLMKKLGLKQSQIVALTGKSKASISMYLNDKVTPPEEVQEEIAIALGLGADYFKAEEPKEIKLKEAVENGIPTLSLVEVSKLMRKHVHTISLGLQQGVFPWGYAIQTSENRWSYFINAKRFAEIEKIEL